MGLFSFGAQQNINKPAGDCGCGCKGAGDCFPKDDAAGFVDPKQPKSETPCCSPSAGSIAVGSLLIVGGVMLLRR